MRAFTLVSLFVGILTTNLGLTSPVPDTGNNLGAFTTVNGKGDNDNN